MKTRALGKKRPLIEKTVFEINEIINTSIDLVREIVKKNVLEYNKKQIDKPIFKYLTNEKISNLEATGKIGFNDRKNENQADLEDAIKNALEAYKDGIFKILINETEILYEDKISIKENDEITFIRLTMLSGGKW